MLCQNEGHFLFIRTVNSENSLPQRTNEPTNQPTNQLTNQQPAPCGTKWCSMGYSRRFPSFTEHEGPLYSLLSPADPHHKAGESRALRHNTFLEALLQHLPPVYWSSFQAVFFIQFPCQHFVRSGGCERDFRLPSRSRRTALFCVITQRLVVIPYRRFGTTCCFVITQKRAVLNGGCVCQPTFPPHCRCPLSDYSNNT